MFNLLCVIFKKRPHIKHRSAYHVELIQVFGAKVKESAGLVEDAMTAKQVAFKCGGALWAIQASMGIITTWSRGDSRAVSARVMNCASTNTPGQSRCPSMEAKIESHNRQAEQRPRQSSRSLPYRWWISQPWTQRKKNMPNKANPLLMSHRFEKNCRKQV